MNINEIAILSTTHVDLHNERMSKTALEHMVDLINGTHARGLTVEHDPTLPPVGKIVEGWVEQAEDGEYRACGVLEYFDKPQPIVLEDGTSLLFQQSETDHRPFSDKHESPSEEFVLAYDRQNFRTSNDNARFLEKINAIEPVRSLLYARKALISDPQVSITVTALLAGFLAGRLMPDSLVSRAKEQLDKLRKIVSVSLHEMSELMVPRNKEPIHVLNIPGTPNIELIAKTRNMKLLETAISEDALRKVKDRSEHFARILNAQTVQFLLDKAGNWDFNYLYAADGKIIGTPAAYENQAKALQILKLNEQKQQKALPSRRGKEKRKTSMSMPFRSPIDFLIITPLPEECEAVLVALSSNQRPEKAEKTPFDQHIYYPIKFPFISAKADEIYRLVVAPLRKMGRIEAASTAASAIRRWRPNYIILVGIAGGTRQAGVGLGDIVIADQVVDYEMQKLLPAGPEVRYEGEPTDRDLLGAAQAMNADWQLASPLSRPDSSAARVHYGPMLSGDKVVAVEDGVRKYRADWPKMIGLEMEAAGVLAACKDVPQKKRPGFFMIRGVSDLADENKNREEVKAWRPYAASAASAFLLHLLKSAPIVPAMRSFRAPQKVNHEDE